MMTIRRLLLVSGLISPQAIAQSYIDLPQVLADAMSTSGSANQCWGMDPTGAFQEWITPAGGGGGGITALIGGVTASGSGSVMATVVTNANLTGPINSSGNATSIASQTGTGTTFVMSASPTIGGTLTTATQLETGQYSNSLAATASTPVIFLSGSPFQGTGTTSRPMFLIEDAASPSTTWNVLGTYIGLNAISTATGTLLELDKAGTTEFSVSASGAGTFRGTMQSAQVTVGTAGILTTGNNVPLILGSTRTFSTTDQVQLATSTNNASSGGVAAVSILPVYNQTLTAGGTDLLINRTNTVVGSGNQFLWDAQVGGSSKGSLGTNGNLTIIGNVFSAGFVGNTFIPSANDGVITVGTTGRTYGTANDTVVRLANATSSATSGQFTAVAITPTYNQASGSGTNTDLLVNRTETAIGSGAQRLLDLQVASTTKFNVDRTGTATLANLLILPVQGSGVTPACAAGQNGAIALTHAFIGCVCNASSWVKIADGSTACTF